MEGAQMRELLTRRIGPAPVWVYFIIFVLATAVFLRWRQTKKTGAAAVDAGSNPGITSEANLTPAPFYNDIFINVQQPVVGGSTTPTPTPTPVPTPAPPPRVKSITYQVHSGDTLSAIAAKYHTTVSKIYTLNKSLIESVAHQHGLSSSGGGHWIWSGERLLIPT
jgi:LysM repeat protein